MELRAFALTYILRSFILSLIQFIQRVLLSCPGQAQSYDPLASASQVAESTGLYLFGLFVERELMSCTAAEPFREAVYQSPSCAFFSDHSPGA